VEKINFIEQRKSPRVLCGKKVKAFVQPDEKPIHVHDISEHGALLKSRTRFSSGDVLDLSMDLPAEPASIDISAKVIRMVSVRNQWGFCNFDIGVKFIDLIEVQKKMLSQTIAHLDSLTKKTKS
jgi:hypothetical protein